MPDCRVHVSEDAQEQLDSIAYDLLKLAGFSTAQRTVDRLYKRFEILMKHPQAGELHPNPILSTLGYRKLVCGNYIAVYKISGDTVYIEGVFHGATNYPERFK